MEEEKTILEEDARTMVRLLADVVSSQKGQVGMKQTLMDGLCSMIGADFWIWGLAADYDPVKGPIYTAMTSGGFEEEQVPKLLLALDNRELEDMLRPLGFELVKSGKQVTRIPQEYDPEKVFGREHIAEAWKNANIAAPLLCYRPVANNCLSGIGIYRKWGRPPFSKRDAQIVDIIMSEVGWLHEQGWPWESALKVPDLPQRCRMALNLLLEGLSRKRIASEMSISINTLNEYIKHIYRFYSVHSHAELVNRFRIGQQ